MIYSSGALATRLLRLADSGFSFAWVAIELTGRASSERAASKMSSDRVLYMAERTELVALHSVAEKRLGDAGDDRADFFMAKQNGQPPQHGRLPVC